MSTKTSKHYAFVIMVFFSFVIAAILFSFVPSNIINKEQYNEVKRNLETNCPQMKDWVRRRTNKYGKLTPKELETFKNLCSQYKVNI